MVEIWHLDQSVQSVARTVNSAPTVPTVSTVDQPGVSVNVRVSTQHPGLVRT